MKHRKRLKKLKELSRNKKKSLKKSKEEPQEMKCRGSPEGKEPPLHKKVSSMSLTTLRALQPASLTAVASLAMCTNNSSRTL